MSPSKTYRLVWTTCLSAAVAFGAGCGSGKPQPVPVRGTVTLDGKPLADAMVTFLSTDPSGLPALGKTDSQGAFVLTTHKMGDGALPGEYKVVVTKEATQDPLADQPTGGGEHRSTGDIMARNTRRSPAGRAKLMAAKKKLPGSPIPSPYRQVTTTPLHETVPPAGEVHLDLHSKG